MLGFSFFALSSLTNFEDGSETIETIFDNGALIKLTIFTKVFTTMTASNTDLEFIIIFNKIRIIYNCILDLFIIFIRLRYMI